MCLWLTARRVLRFLTQSNCAPSKRQVVLFFFLNFFFSPATFPSSASEVQRSNTYGEIEKLPNWRTARWQDGPRSVTGPERRQSGEQPGVVSPGGHSVSAGRTPAGGDDSQTGTAESTAPGTGCVHQRHVPESHVPLVGSGRAPPGFRIRRLHAAGAERLPGAPEGGGHCGLPAPGALDPSRDHDATTSRLRL